MKKLLLLMAMCLPLIALAQSEDSAKKLTKFEEFSSKTGRILKFVDVVMPRIVLNFGSLDAGIRTVVGLGENSYFYRIEKGETSSSVSRIAMIEYSDLVEINKALSKLTTEVNDDCLLNPDYLENKFITEDGFQIGYYVSKGKANWYMKLESYSSSTVFLKDADSIINDFIEAQKKIEELKANYKK